MSRKKNKFIVMVVAFALISIMLIGCSYGEELDGAWTTGENGPVIEFSGTSFAVTQKVSQYITTITVYDDNPGVEIESGRMMRSDYEPKYVSETVFPITEAERNIRIDEEVIHTTSHLERTYGDDRPRTVRNYFRCWDVLTKGEYSLTDNEIELILSDGTILVGPFSRTANTISIGRYRFTRVKR